jgi:PleD family two-component response regulator
MNRRLPASSRAAVRVLVIDDDEFECAYLVDILKTAGFNVTSMPSVIGVTNHLVQEGVQVVVLDVMMPTIRGDKLAALWRRNPALPRLGVVLVSSLPEDEITPLLADAEVDAFVSKALVRSELATVVGSVANRP